MTYCNQKSDVHGIKSRLGLSSYRATFQSHFVRVTADNQMTDEQWLMYLRNMLHGWFRCEKQVFGDEVSFTQLLITRDYEYLSDLLGYKIEEKL